MIPSQNQPLLHQGHDAIYIARTLGLETLGIDVATIAVEKANGSATSVYINTGLDGESPRNVQSEGLTNVKFDKTDFFTYTTEDKFDLVYDFTYVASTPWIRNNTKYKIQILRRHPTTPPCLLG